MNQIEEIFSPLIESGRDLYWLGQSSDASIEMVEKLLEVKFPSSLRFFLSTYGGGGVVGEEISGIEDNNPNLRNRGTLLGDTDRCRRESELSSELVVVYFSEEGVCWCIDCSGDGEGPVVSYSLFKRKVDAEIAPSFLCFLRQYVELRTKR